MFDVKPASTLNSRFIIFIFLPCSKAILIDRGDWSILERASRTGDIREMTGVNYN
ncbi:hypothetical protein [Roseovarius tolerans]|uniref:hypothetical protein n=1 Tax=Roseovarius tolerans TaxID=74031 RepID=UPI001C319922|nr:hypothetical protein [Roseovarius tolerans]